MAYLLSEQYALFTFLFFYKIIIIQIITKAIKKEKKKSIEEDRNCKWKWIGDK